MIPALPEALIDYASYSIRGIISRPPRSVRISSIRRRLFFVNHIFITFRRRKNEPHIALNYILRDNPTYGIHQTKTSPCSAKGSHTRKTSRYLRSLKAGIPASSFRANDSRPFNQIASRIRRLYPYLRISPEGPPTCVQRQHVREDHGACRHSL